MKDGEGRDESKRLRIRRGLENNFSRVWGYHIYRCTYEDDSRWARFLELWNEEIIQNLTKHDNLDLLSSMDMRIHEDKSTLDGAGADQVREEFRKWLASEDCAKESEGLLATNYGTRYHKCIYIDKEALESIVAETPEAALVPAPGKRVPYYHMVDVYWGAPIPGPMGEEITKGDEEYDEEDDESWPGSMKISLLGVLGHYELLDDMENWYNMAKQLYMGDGIYIM